MLPKPLASDKVTMCNVQTGSVLWRVTKKMNIYVYSDAGVMNEINICGSWIIE